MKQTVRVFSTFALIVFCTSLISAQTTQRSTNHEKDEAAIKAKLEQVVAGWNAKSGEAFARPFTENADVVVVTGFHIKTRAEIAKQHQLLFDGMFKDVALSEYKIEQIRYLRPDVVLVHVLGQRTDESDKTKTKSGRLTFVMVKNKGQWQIEAFQNTLIQQQ